MKVLLIGTKASSLDAETYYKSYLDFFRRASGYSQKQPAICHVLLDELIISIGDGKFNIYDTRNKCELSEFDLVFIRGHVRQHIDETRAISEYLNHKNIAIVNDYSGFRSSSKLIQALQFYKLGLPTPATVLLNQAVVANPSRLPFSLPCVMKDTYGSHGNNNHIVHNFGEVTKIQQASPNKNFVLQHFIPNDSDYRVLLVGSEQLIIKRSSAIGSHLNNTSQGGKAEIVNSKDFPDIIIEQSRKLAAALGNVVAGVDVLYDHKTGKHFFLEVNSQPQLMTGAFVEEKAKLVARYLDEVC